jgi:cell division protein FtsQ
MEERLQKFASVYQNTLANLGVKVMYADLRYPNGFAVRRPLKVNAPGAKAPEPATNKTGAA